MLHSIGNSTDDNDSYEILYTANCTGGRTKQSCQLSPRHMNCITTSQALNSMNAVIIIAKALGSTTINSHPLTYMEAMVCPQHDHWKRAMDVVCTSILVNETIIPIISREAIQLWLIPSGSKCVGMMKHTPDSNTQCKAHLLIAGYKQMDFGET